MKIAQFFVILLINSSGFKTIGQKYGPGKRLSLEQAPRNDPTEKSLVFHNPYGQQAYIGKRTVVYLLPFFVPLVGLAVYEPLATLVRQGIIMLGKNGWIFVDGGQYKAEILAPTINGIVVPTISIDLATLVAGTLSSLRERQSTIRTCLNKEWIDLQLLVPVVKTLSAQHRSAALQCIHMHCTNVLEETWRAYAFRDNQVLESLSNFGRNESLTPSTSSTLQAAVASLSSTRAIRLSALQHSFPLIHWAVITLLGCSVLLCFMLETDQDTLKFLDGAQLRILFMFLMGAVSSTALLCFDLSRPFCFEFSRRPPECVRQLLILRDRIESAANEAHTDHS